MINMKHCQSPTSDILGISIHTGKTDKFVSSIISLAKCGIGAYVCFVNAHMAVEASNDLQFKAIVNNADLACPDGMPIAKCISWMYGKPQERISGPEILPILLEAAWKDDLGVFVLGGTEIVLSDFIKRANEEFPGLICGSYSPPFRKLTESENSDITKRINESKANMVLVSLGCPKQEKWMAAYKCCVNACMLGLGFAIPVYAGHAKRAPHWMQTLGLEWLHRLKNNPKKLWRRYLYTNIAFIWKISREILSRSILRREARI
jgi:N-acetylglucosaminyldiphosphoundecaprenol N-acetyl-beta-D-mannosaminyltransferase